MKIPLNSPIAIPSAKATINVADSEYYNIYSKEPAAKVTIYTSILYFVIVIYESMVDVFLQ